VAARTTPFPLVVHDTQGLAPDPRLIESLGAQGAPVLLLTGRFDQARWAAAPAGLDTRATLVRPIFCRRLVGKDEPRLSGVSRVK